MSAQGGRSENTHNQMVSSENSNIWMQELAAVKKIFMSAEGAKQQWNLTHLWVVASSTVL